MSQGRKSRPLTASLSPATRTPVVAADRLLADVRALIEAAREQTARAVNSALVDLYWHIGTRIRQDILKKKRAEYGAEIVSALGTQLTAEYGRGFSEKSLRHMLRFAEAFPDDEIVSALRRELSWTHFKEIIYIDDPLKREFYAEMCRAERWSTRTLHRKIGHLLYERTALSKRPDEVIVRDITALRDDDRMTPDLVFRDPYFLDFLGLTTGTYAAEEHVELLQLDASGIHVAQYLTELPPRELLEKKLHDSIRRARERLAAGSLDGGPDDRPTGVSLPAVKRRKSKNTGRG